MSTYQLDNPMKFKKYSFLVPCAVMITSSHRYNIDYPTQTIDHGENTANSLQYQLYPKIPFYSKLSPKTVYQKLEVTLKVVSYLLSLKSQVILYVLTRRNPRNDIFREPIDSRAVRD